MTSKRGFASMDPEKRRQIASLGGKSVPPEKRAFSLNREFASDAGRRGGIAVAAAQRSFARNRELAREAGRESWARRKALKPLDSSE